MTQFANHVAIVTGGTSGIGKAIAQRLAAAGAKVFVIGRDRAKLDALRAETPAIAVHAADVADEAQVQAAIAACRAQLGPVTILVNNAGLGIPTPDLATTDVAALRTMLETNVVGSFLCSKAVLPDMKAAGAGHIINLVSVVGKKTNPLAPLYCTSKFGQRGFSSGLADQVLPLGIKVTDLNPGATDTAYWGERQVPRQKFLQPADVAEAALFVLSLPPHVLIRELDLESMHMLRKS
ncbi:MAG: SDR family oxidoreductase [Planctomycetes bacterium]|nr:SDR family oxidoreductase [Planctomycetota bacterium]